jgi:hypothetical protein
MQNQPTTTATLTNAAINPAVLVTAVVNYPVQWQDITTPWSAWTTPWEKITDVTPLTNL